MRESAAKILKLVLINGVLLIVLLETASLAVYFFKTGEVFYRRDRSRISATRSELEKATLASKNRSLAYQLHPYFGFVAAEGYDAQAYVSSSPTVPHHTNNYGFFCPHDFPFKKTSKNQLVVGVFGGSVARFFSFFELESHALAKALQTLPQFRDREIVVLNFAGGSYKQPQQLLVLNYFLSIGQELDMVINIDGYNDVVFPYLNNKAGIELSMPNSQVALPLIDLANKDLRLDDLALSLEILQQKTQLTEGLAKLDDCSLATCYSLRWIWVTTLFNQYQKKTLAFNEMKRNGSNEGSLVQLSRIETPASEPEVYEQLADRWANSSLAMEQLLSARGISYFHFIQPNQYYPTRHNFSEAEKKVAFSDDNPSREVVPLGYSKLLARLNGLQQAGVKVFNEANVFDEVTETVYIDNCCHLTQIGNGILIGRVAQRITTSINDKTASKQK